MDQYRRLRENLQKVGSPARLSIYQGIVKAVDGDTCSVEFGKITVSGVKLRASVADVQSNLYLFARGVCLLIGYNGGFDAMLRGCFCGTCNVLRHHQGCEDQ